MTQTQNSTDPTDSTDPKSSPTKETTKHGARHHGHGALWVASIVSGLAVVAVAVASLVVSPAITVVDTAGKGVGASSQQVSQTLLTGYCPAQLGLQDQESYGDAEFSVSQGNLASAVRYSAIGSVYGLAVSGLAGKETKDLTTGSDILTSGGVNAENSSLMSATLLGAEDGTGSTGTVASWASQGDIQGLAATSCVDSSLASSFLVPSTETGRTNTLVVANSSNKPTTVNVRFWGTDSGKEIAASTGSALTLGAHSEKTLDLSAAASGKKGVYITVSSTVVPVYSVVKSSAASGLTSKGVDYLRAVDSTKGDTALVGFSAKQAVTLRAFSGTDQEISASWMNGEGVQQTKTISLSAHQVAVTDLGEVPDGATALQVTSADPVYLSAEATVSSNGQSDFAFVQPTPSVTRSAATLPDGVSGTLSFANTGDHDASISVEGFDAQGASLGEHKVTVASQRSHTMAVTDLGKGTKTVTVTRDGSSAGSVTWGVQLSVDSLSKAKVAEASVVGATSLMPRKTTVIAERSLLASVE